MGRRGKKKYLQFENERVAGSKYSAILHIDIPHWGKGDPSNGEMHVV